MPSREIILLKDVDFNDKTYTFRVSLDTSDLESSISEEGLLYPPILLNKGSSYAIVCGYRRLNALKKLGTDSVEAQVYEKGEIEEKKLLRMSVMENLKRRSLKPIEISKALKRIKESMGYNNEELAEHFGEAFNLEGDASLVEKYLELDNLEIEQKQVLYNAKDKIGLSLTGVQNKEERDALIEILKNNEKMSEGTFKKIMEGSKKLKNLEEDASLKKLLDEEELQEVFRNPELSANKKINRFIDEMERRIDPSKKDKLQKLDERLTHIENVLKNYNGKDLSEKIHIRKRNLHEKAVSVSLELDDMSEFKDIVECLYQMRNKLSDVINL